MFFTRFNFTVTYRPGTKNIKADALSRQTDQTNYPKIEENIIPETLLVTPVSFNLDLPANYHISATFHASVLKPADSPSEESQGGRNDTLLQCKVVSIQIV